jgi:RNA polymerase sigma-70 factor (ECF subfamily)
MGQAETFAAVLQEHQSMVFSIAYHFLRDPAHAEDIAQEVFLRLSERLGTLETPEHRRFWLRKVTARLCIDELRRRPSRSLRSLDEVPEPVSEFHQEDFLVSEQLRRLVAGLPEHARMAVILRYQEEMEPAEIAEVLKESVNTVKSRLQRALATLREGFQGRGVGP